MKEKKIILASLLSLSCMAQANDENITTIGLIKDSAKAMPNCLEYCINQVVLKMKITWHGPVFYWTLNVGHNSPNWITMTHPQLDNSPWSDYNLLFGNAYQKIADGITKAVIPFDANLDTGRYQHQNWGTHQAVQSSEATVIGHPGAMILSMFGTGGLKADGYWVSPRWGKEEDRYWHQCKTHGCLEEKNTAIGQGIRQSDTARRLTFDQKKTLAENYLVSWKNGSYTGQIYNIFDYMQVHDTLKNMSALSNFFKSFGRVFKVAASSVGARIDHVFCEMEIAPFAPYYLSGVDAVAWRSGYPVTDPEHSATIVNPLSSDVIGAQVYDSTLKTTIDEKWGHIYPRDGTVNNPNSAKVAAIVAYRANSVLADQHKSATRIYRKPHENTVGAWNKIIPSAQTTTPGAKNSACHKKIANSGILVNDKRKYAYTSWPRYSCDLAGGTTIARVSFNKCLTDKVPN